MKFELHKGASAQQWAVDLANRNSWVELYAKCERSTACLSVDFFEIWSRHYIDVWDPLLIVAHNVSGEFVGLMPLAHREGKVVGAGAHQAEYQGWICASDVQGEFLDGALDLLFAEYPDARLVLRYVDCGENTERLLRWANARADVLLTEHARPLLAIDAEAIEAILRKRPNRSKLNRLKRVGKLEMSERLMPEDLETVLDHVVRMYDLRQGAANDSCPFADDERKRPFYFDLLRSLSSSMPLYQLTLDGEIIAALLTLRGPGLISNAIFSYSTQHARHSPGKMLLYLTAQSLADSDVEYLDLTPGGDPWKERFATDHDRVFEMEVRANAAQVVWAQRRNRAEAILRDLLISVRLKPSRLREWVAIARRINPRAVWRRARSFLPSRTEYRVYRMRLTDWAASPGDKVAYPGTPPSIDDLRDLVRFRPVASCETRQRFLSSALARLEKGERVYTIRNDKALLHYGWLIREQSQAFFSEVEAHYRYPEPGAVLYNFFTHPAARGQGCYQRTIATMLRDLAATSSDEDSPRVVYISVLADNAASRHVIEKLGFEHVDSIVRIGAFGWSRLVGGT